MHQYNLGPEVNEFIPKEGIPFLYILYNVHSFMD